MTENFRILEDYDVSKIHQREIKSEINEIEKLVMGRENLRLAYTLSGIILENIFADDYPNIRDLGLTKVITNLTSIKVVPTKVKDALYSIRNARNEFSHADLKRSNKPFKIEPGISSIIELLKKLFKIVKYFVRERNLETWANDNDNDYAFSEDHYFTNLNIVSAQMQKDIDLEDVTNDTTIIESRLVGIFELISSPKVFLIPTYQRDYNWSSQNIETFLEDIEERSKDNKTHYMGSLALGISEEKDDVLRLIDGQQRITTCLLLIRAFINQFQKFNIPKELKSIEDKLPSKYINKESAFNRVGQIRKILQNNLASNDLDFKKSSAYLNFQQIEKKLQKMELSALDSFYTSFFSNFVVSQVNFKYEIDHEIQVFENLNSKGTVLSEWDLIKNYIYKNVSLRLLLENETELDELINKLFLFNASAYFKRNKEKKLAIFFEFFCRMENKLKKEFPLTSHKKTYVTFSHLWPSEKGRKFDSIDELRNSLVRIARLFNIFCLLESKEYLQENSLLYDLRLHLENLEVKNAHFPLIMNAILQNSRWEDIGMEKIPIQNMEKLIDFFSDIDKYVTRLITASNEGQSLSLTFDSCITKTIKESQNHFLQTIQRKGLQTTLPSLQEFQDVLENKNSLKSSYAKAILRTISWNANKKNNENNAFLFKSKLEYIYPQKHSSKSMWLNDSGLSSLNFEKEIDENANKIGNCIMVDSTLSNLNKNKNFLDKKEIYKSIKDKTFISDIELKKLDLFSKKEFTFDDIKKRTSEIAKKAVELYKLSFER